MMWKRYIWLIAVCTGLLGSAVQLAVQGGTERALWEKRQQEGIAGEVLRFHVLANSDSAADQAVKMEVKAQVLDYLREQMPEYDSAADTRLWIGAHLEEIRGTARTALDMRRYAQDYPVEVRLLKTWFPEKSYGDCVFPAGVYEALQIRIGRAGGHNWWCVLYPSLCFTDALHGVVNEEQKKELRHVLTENEYDVVTGKIRFKIRFRWLPL